MPTTTSLEFGDVVIVDVPFTDLKGVKRRPAVLVASLAYLARSRDVLVMPITSRPPAGQTSLDMPLLTLNGTGLHKASAVKAVLSTLDKTSVSPKIGRLGREDRKRLLQLTLFMLPGVDEVAPPAKR